MKVHQRCSSRDSQLLSFLVSNSLNFKISHIPCHHIKFGTSKKVLSLLFYNQVPCGGFVIWRNASTDIQTGKPPNGLTLKVKKKKMDIKFFIKLALASVNTQANSKWPPLNKDKSSAPAHTGTAANNKTCHKQYRLVRSEHIFN